MGAQVVHHHELPWLKTRREDPLHVGLENPGGGSPFHGQRWPHPSERHARKQRRVLPAVAWHRKMQALSFEGVAVDWRQRGVRPHLIDKDQPLGLDRRCDHHPPGGSLGLVPFGCGSSPFFLVEPIRATARHIVERLTESPVMASM